MKINATDPEYVMQATRWQRLYPDRLVCVQGEPWFPKRTIVQIGGGNGIDSVYIVGFPDERAFALRAPYEALMPLTDEERRAAYAKWLAWSEKELASFDYECSATENLRTRIAWLKQELA